MRILQIHNRHKGRGGADFVVDHEAELLEAAGHRTERYFHPSAEETGGSGLSQGVKAIWNAEACRDVDRLIKIFDPDVVHVHTPFPLLSPAIFRVAARHGKPAVTTAHSFRYSCVRGTCLRDGEICEDCVGKAAKLPGIRHRCYHDSLAGSAALTLGLTTHRVLGTFRRHVDRFITLTDFARQLLVRDGVAADKVVVKPNSILDPGAAPTRDGAASYAAFVGRFVGEKGIETLLRAWRSEGIKIPLRIAGDGPLRSLVDAEAARNPMVESVGWLNEAQLNDFVSGAELVVVPSQWYEAGEPLVLLRALALGRPAIVSDLDNICATVRETDSGRTFAVGDAQALADAVAACVDQLDELRAMGRRGRAAYERGFTPQRNLEQLEAIYRDVQRVQRERQSSPRRSS
ncbi:MAG: glycosyltransferase family 4 protein [Stackebrandtia sp.]